MKITWLGHSCFKLEESTGTTLVTDPYHEYVGYEMIDVEPDILTISHAHKDHNCMDHIKGSPTLINRSGFYEMDGVHILGLKSYHDEAKGSKRGENLIFKVRMDGVDVIHMGDIGEDCNAMISEALGACNILMIPVGGVYTIDAEQAKEYVDRLMPDIVIPMHYKTKDCDFNIDKLNDFLDYFDEENIIYAEDSTLEFDRADFDGEETKVLILEKVSK